MCIKIQFAQTGVGQKESHVHDERRKKIDNTNYATTHTKPNLDLPQQYTFALLHCYAIQMTNI